MQHKITREFGGEREMGWIQPVCTCGWKGKKHYAYNDYQHSNAREEGDHHIRQAQQPRIVDPA
ncbi:hypothetical protein GCM10011348_46330 [Marinobacterium nitratireducens]|uniref:Uncharacterized protein n=1 Tax=Marinobacterium nitratireducens TaxID=518897 RepID=A0A917ZQY5_9GAMM|nr:hypothetical protein [Marinobacterium nitratireducens]GGO89181.1 hypothetical protein GCM10011348_46330 [Marinobacterium nitratireducens]